MKQDKYWALIQKLRPFARLVTQKNEPITGAKSSCFSAESLAEHFYKTKLTRNGGIQKSNLDDLPDHQAYAESAQYSVGVEKKVDTWVESKNFDLKSFKNEKISKKGFGDNSGKKNLSIRRAIEYGLKKKEDRTTEKTLRNQNLADLEL